MNVVVWRGLKFYLVICMLSNLIECCRKGACYLREEDIFNTILFISSKDFTSSNAKMVQRLDLIGFYLYISAKRYIDKYDCKISCEFRMDFGNARFTGVSMMIVTRGLAVVISGPGRNKMSMIQAADLLNVGRTF